MEDLNTPPLRARLAKQLLHLVRSYGVPSLADGGEVRIGLQLAQEELAQLLGASRQRVNQELEVHGARGQRIRIEPGGLVVRNRASPDAHLRSRNRQSTHGGQALADMSQDFDHFVGTRAVSAAARL